jgi:predicted Na+-dependent transporter
MTLETRLEVQLILSALQRGELSSLQGVEQLTALGIVPLVAGILIRQVLARRALAS